MPSKTMTVTQSKKQYGPLTWSEYKHGLCQPQTKLIVLGCELLAYMLIKSLNFKIFSNQPLNQFKYCLTHLYSDIFHCLILVYFYIIYFFL